MTPNVVARGKLPLSEAITPETAPKNLVIHSLHPKSVITSPRGISDFLTALLFRITITLLMFVTFVKIKMVPNVDNSSFECHYCKTVLFYRNI